MLGHNLDVHLLGSFKPGGLVLSQPRGKSEVDAGAAAAVRPDEYDATDEESLSPLKLLISLYVGVVSAAFIS